MTPESDLEIFQHAQSKELGIWEQKLPHLLRTPAQHIQRQ